MTSGLAPLPSRPTLVTPPHLQSPHARLVQRERLAAQPMLGLGGVLLAVVAFVIFAWGTGDVETSLLVLGPMVTFALPAVAVVAFWCNDWPGSRLTTPWTGLVNTVLVAAAGVVLTVAGLAVVDGFDPAGVFTPGRTFPSTIPLAGAVFTVLLQLTFVCERWPLQRLGLLSGGVAALVLSWAVGVGVWFLLRDAPGVVLAAGMWQAVFFIALRGWPVNRIGGRAVRIAVGNGLVIGLGMLTREVRPPVAACVIGAVLFVGILFEGWPASLLPSWACRVVTLVLTALIAAGLYYGLTAYAESVAWTRAEPAEWVTTAALSFLGAGIILHVGIGLRWPFAAESKENA